MTEIDINDDDALRFIQRVLESNAPEQDRKAARDLVVSMRARVRKEYLSGTAAQGQPKETGK